MSGSMYSVSNIADGTLVEEFQGGETRVLDEIVERHRKYVYSLAYHFSHNCEDAYDISQEVFIKVFKSLSSLRNGSTFDAWLRRVIVNTSIDYLRQRPNDRVLGDSAYADHVYAARGSGELPNRSVETTELRNVILRAVDRLPKRQRKGFVLRHYDDLPLKDIARTLNCSSGTVKAHLFHANRRLRKLLSPYVS